MSGDDCSWETLCFAGLEVLLYVTGRRLFGAIWLAQIPSPVGWGNGAEMLPYVERGAGSGVSIETGSVAVCPLKPLVWRKCCNEIQPIVKTVCNFEDALTILRSSAGVSAWHSAGNVIKDLVKCYSIHGDW